MSLGGVDPTLNRKWAVACTVCECESTCACVYSTRYNSPTLQGPEYSLVSSSHQSSNCVQLASLSSGLKLHFPFLSHSHPLAFEGRRTGSELERDETVTFSARDGVWPTLTKMSGFDSSQTLVLPLSWILRGKQTLQDSTDFTAASQRLPVTEWNNEEAERKQCCWQPPSTSGLSNHISVTPFICSHFSALQPSRRATLKKQQATKVLIYVSEHKVQFKDERDLATLSWPDERMVYMQRDAGCCLCSGSRCPSGANSTTAAVDSRNLWCDQSQWPSSAIVLIILCMLLFSTQIRRNNPRIPLSFLLSRTVFIVTCWEFWESQDVDTLTLWKVTYIVFTYKRHNIGMLTFDSS